MDTLLWAISIVVPILAFGALALLLVALPFWVADFIRLLRR
jgi:hypothetical protein